MGTVSRGDRVRWLGPYGYYAYGQVTIVRGDTAKVLFDGGFDWNYDYYKISDLERLGMLYRKKPVVISAARWFKNGDHPEDDPTMIANAGAGEPYIPTEGKVVRYFRRPDVPGEKPCEHCGVAMNDHGWIDTLEGGHIVCPGDWIITGVVGERYPCKPDIFAATYEPV